MGKVPSFAVDIMLGKLAKWLRLMGFDTFYSNTATDDFLMGLTLKEGRILLTRDRPLAVLLKTSAYFVQNIFLREQLIEVTARFQLQHFRLPRRCSTCNGELASIKKTDAKEQAPPYVFQTRENFFRCQNCGKLYWEGTHIRHIKETISSTLKKVSDGKTISPGKDDE